jgi:hypothetical protein
MQKALFWALLREDVIFPGSQTEGAHLLPVVIRNLRADGHHYARATLPFPVKESDNLFGHYRRSGYWFGKAGRKKSCFAENCDVSSAVFTASIAV